MIKVLKKAKLNVFSAAFSSRKPLKLASSSEAQQASQSLDKSLLNLDIQKTEFNPRFHAVENEKKYHPLTTSDLYDWQVDRPTPKVWTTLDLPISIHGDLHFGHFYNKTLKDIINRYKLLKGYKVNFALGFNCHGLAVENAAMRQVMQSEVIKDFTDNEIRDVCKNYAAQSLKKYLNSIYRWGIMTNLKQSYITMSPLYEACVLELFRTFLDKKLIKRTSRPLYWSIKRQKAISEDEIEANYEEVPARFIQFRVVDFKSDRNLARRIDNLTLIVHSTELWTLTGVQAVALNPLVNYTIFELDHKFYMFSTQKFSKEFGNKVKNKGGRFLAQILGKGVEDFIVEDPLTKKRIRVCMDESIRASVGTGIAPVCPAHFIDDYFLAQSYDITKKGYIDQEGCLLPNRIEAFTGKPVHTGELSKLVVDYFKEKDLLFKFEEEIKTIKYKHLITKEEIILRDEQAWFCTIPDYIREDLMEELKQAQFIGKSKNDEYPTLMEAVQHRSSEFCISTAGKWGIPIPVFLKRGKEGKEPEIFLDKHVIDHVIGLVRSYGSEIWWKWKIENLLPTRYKHMADKLEKATEIFDTKFETGTAWFAVLIHAIHEKKEFAKLDPMKGDVFVDTTEENQETRDTVSKTADSSLENNYFPASLVVEGVEQNAAMIEANTLLAGLAEERIFFLTSKNHPVVTDNEQEKISKFSKFRIDVEDLIEGAIKANGQRQYGFGVDILRLWSAASDLENKEVDEIFLMNHHIDIKNAEINMLRKIYWTILRYLGNFKTTDTMNLQRLTKTDELMTTQLYLFLKNVDEAYDQFNLAKAYTLIIDFMKNYVNDFYLEAVKNRVIVEKGTKRQLSARKTLALILDLTLMALAPILCHNAEDIYAHIKHKDKSQSFFHNRWPHVDENVLRNKRDEFIIFKFLFEIREKILEQYKEIANRMKYTDPWQFEVVFVAAEDSYESTLLKFLGEELIDFLSTSNFRIVKDPALADTTSKSLSSFKYKGSFSGISVNLSIKIYKRDSLYSCVRCWKYVNSEKGRICPDCREHLPQESVLAIEKQTADSLVKVV